MDERESEAQVQPRHHQRQGEHRQQLAVDAPAYVALGHAHLLHDVEPALVLIALGQLLVVDDGRRREDKHDAQHDAQEEQPAVGTVEVRPVGGFGLHADAHVPVTADARQIVVQRILQVGRHAVDVPLLVFRQIGVKGVVPCGRGIPAVFVRQIALQLRHELLKVRHHHRQGRRDVRHRSADQRGDLPLHHMAGHAAVDGQRVTVELRPQSRHIHLPVLQRQALAGDGVVLLQRHEVYMDDVGAVRCGRTGVSQPQIPAVRQTADADLTVCRHIAGLPAEVENGALHALTQLLRLRLVQRMIASAVYRHVHVAGIPGIHRVLLPHIQAGGGGDHHQHHGGQNAHRRQSRAVALHPVGHGGHGHEVLGPVVVFFVSLQAAAQRHRAADKQQIGGDDDHDDRRKEPQQRRQRLLDGHRQRVSAAQQHRARRRQHPLGSGRLLPHVLAAQQRDGAHAPQPPQPVQQDQHVDDGEQRRRCQQRADGHRQGVRHLHLQQPHHAQLRQLVQRHAQQQSRRRGHTVGDGGLPQQDAGDVALAHAQYVVQAELPFPAPHQEGVGIEQEQQREHGDDHRAQPQYYGTAAAAGHILQHRRAGQPHEDVEHQHHTAAAQQVRQVQSLVFHHARPGQAGVQRLFHTRSPPDCSIVSVSVMRW